MLLVYALMDGRWDCSCLLEILQTCFVAHGCVPGIAGPGTFQELSACSPKQLRHLTSSDRVSEFSWPFIRVQPRPHSASRSATLPRSVVFPRLCICLKGSHSSWQTSAQSFQASLHLKLKHRRHQRTPYQSWLTCSFISSPIRPHRAHVTAPWTNTEPGSQP